MYTNFTIFHSADTIPTMSSGLINEVRKLARIAQPLIDNLDLLTPRADALIDGTSGTNRVWRIYDSADYTFQGRSLSDKNDKLLITVRSTGTSILESESFTPDHDIWFVRACRQPSSVEKFGGNLTEASVKATFRDLRLTLQKISK